MSNEHEQVLMTRIEYDTMLEKYNKLKETLSDISTSKIKAAYNDPGNTWHDNFAYEQLDLQEDGMLNRINDMMNKLNFAKIIEPKEEKDNSIDIYDNVKLLFTYSDGETEETILSLGKNIDEENNITLNSPLGKAIYGKQIGEEVSYKVNDNEIYVKIIDIVNL